MLQEILIIGCGAVVFYCLYLLIKSFFKKEEKKESYKGVIFDTSKKSHYKDEPVNSFPLQRPVEKVKEIKLNRSGKPNKNTSRNSRSSNGAVDNIAVVPTPMFDDSEYVKHDSYDDNTSSSSSHAVTGFGLGGLFGGGGASGSWGDDSSSSSHDSGSSSDSGGDSGGGDCGGD